MKLKHCFVFPILALLAASTVNGQASATYTGPEDGDFNDPANWAGETLPVDGGNILVTGASPDNYNLTVSTPTELGQVQVGRGAEKSLTVLPGGEVFSMNQAVIGILSGGVGTLNMNGGEFTGNRIRLSLNGPQPPNPGGSVLNLNSGSITIIELPGREFGDLEIGFNADATVNLNGGVLDCVAIALRNGELNINGAGGNFSASGAFDFGLTGQSSSLNFTVDDNGAVSALNVGSFGAMQGNTTLSVAGDIDGNTTVDVELLLISLSDDTFSQSELEDLESVLSLTAASGTLELRNADSELWFNGTVIISASDWQIEFSELTAPVDLDFGEGKDTAGDLLRVRQHELSLEADSVRYQPSVAELRASTALASLGNYWQDQDFVVETEMTIQEFQTLGLDQLGLVVLGGPHVPEEAPFTSSGTDEFYSLSLVAGENAEEPWRLRIRETYTGAILREEDWGGQSIGPVFAFADDFSDQAASEAAWDNPDPWQVGVEGERNVFATDPNESNAKDRDARLRSPVIDLTGLSQVVLSYSDFHELDDDENFHSATVTVRRASDPDGEPLQELSKTTGTVPWGNRAFALNQASLDEGEVIIEFHIITDDWVGDNRGVPIAGWSIADVEVTSISGVPATFAFKAEGAFDSSGLTLALTVSDEGGFEQTISTLIADPFSGNLFGFGGRSGLQSGGERTFDFHDLVINLGAIPAITNIPDQTIFVNHATEPLPFTVFAEGVDPSELTVTGSSSNTGLVPDENIDIAGVGSDRTVTVTPVADATGSTTITLTVAGGSQPASTEFVVDVIPVGPPRISDIADQTIIMNENTGALSFTLEHDTLDPEGLTVSGSSSNTNLVPNENIVFDGSGAERTVTVTPLADQTGTATITVVVDDGDQTGSTSFVLTVAPPPIHVIVNPSNPPSGAFTEGRFWHWETDGDMEDWTAQQFDLEPGTPTNGTLTATATGNDPQWISPAALAIPASEEVIIEFRLRKESDDNTRIDFFWADGAGGFAAARRITVQANELPQDGEFHVVRFHLTGVVTGSLTRMRLDPISDQAGVGFSTDLDYCRVYVLGETAFPTLSIRQSGPDEVRLSWPADAIGWTLQSSSDPSGDTFTDADLDVIMEDDENAAYDQIESPRRFYRLVD